MVIKNVTQIKSGIWINVYVRAKSEKKNMCAKTYIYIWNPNTCTCENGKYLGSIINDSLITCDEIIEATKAIPTKTIAIKIFYILFAFLLITIAQLISNSIYYYLIKYRPKEHLLQYHETNNKFFKKRY